MDNALPSQGLGPLPLVSRGCESPGYPLTLFTCTGEKENLANVARFSILNSQFIWQEST